ncbi:MAG: ATP-binding protein [Proteobacteria bacterium]|nr:ATP-binding protein [Pseudomonadota bacterium]
MMENDLEASVGHRTQTIPRLIGVILHEPSGAIQYANPAAEELLGLTLAQVYGRGALDPRWGLVGLDGGPLTPDELPFEVAARIGTPCTRLLGVRHASGVQVWLQVSADPIGASVSGRTAVVTTFTDVSVEHDSLVALEERRVMLERVNEAVPGVLLQGELGVDGHLQIIYVSSGAREYLGCSPVELRDDLTVLVGRLHPDDGSRFLAELAAQVNRGPSTFDQVLRLRIGDDAWRSLRVRAKSRETQGRTVWTGVALDVTDERRLEQQVLIAQRREGIGAVTAGIAHNFNNALAVILPSLTELTSVVPTDHREMLDDALAASRNAVELVKRLMTVVRGSTQEPAEPFDVVPLLREAVGLAKQIFRNEVALVTNVTITTAPVRGNRPNLQQVLLNLLINARDALVDRPNARVEIDIIAGVTLGLPQVEVRIRDNGIGMSEDTLRRLGEPFFTTKASGEGTGLGLATAFATVRGFGGQLTCQSTPNVGTEFIIRLPLRASEPMATVAQPAKTVLQHGRVLIVDDDRAVRRLVGLVLGRRGFDTVEVDSGEAALATLATAAPFDVGIVDLSLGNGMSGERLLEQLHRDHPTLPVVIMSGFVDAPERLTAATAILEKPIVPDTLVALLADIIRRSADLARSPDARVTGTGDMSHATHA